jgi:hypothetical protein
MLNTVDEDEARHREFIDDSMDQWTRPVAAVSSPDVLQYVVEQQDRIRDPPPSPPPLDSQYSDHVTSRPVSTRSRTSHVTN